MRITVPGLPLAPGLAVGTALFHDELDVDVPVLAISLEDVRSEQGRFTAAISRAKKQLAEFEHGIEEKVGRRDARIFSVQALLLDDKSFAKSVRERIRDQLVNAEAAVHDAVAAWADRLSGVFMGVDRDPVADLKDVGACCCAASPVGARAVPSWPRTASA